MIGSIPRTVLTGALVVGNGIFGLAAPLTGQTSATEDSRPDSIRSFVLDRIRARSMPAEAPDSTTATIATTDSVPGRPLGRGAPSRPTAEGPVDLPARSDSVMRALAQLEGFTTASYQGDRADFDAATRRLILWGTAESRAFFSGSGGRVEADTSITYEDLQGRVRTTGRSDLTPSTGEPLSAERLIYDLRGARGTALGAETTYSQGAQWIVRGNLDSVEEDLLFGSSARFTTCDLDDPHSYFQASELKVVGDQVLVARSVRMYIDDVPVLWLPFIAQNLGSGRVSGILTPTFSINDIVRTSSAYNRRLSNVGYYWAMSDYSDMTVALDWFSNNYLALQGGMRYRWAQRFLEGTVNVKRYWRETGRTELGFDTNHRWDISESTGLRASGRYISSSSFVRQNSFDPRETVSTIDSDANLNRRFGWGQLTVGSSRKQYLSEERTETTLPSASLSLSTLTLLGAPPQTASWYNNVSVSGSMSWDRRLADRPTQPDSTFSFGQASEVRTAGSARGSVSLGDLSLRGAFSTKESVFKDVPDLLLNPVDPDPLGLEAMAGRNEFRSGGVSWSAGLSYQQRLIGATTLTPSFSVEGSMLRVDSIPEAREFVAGPKRYRAGLSLQTDVYGFYPGFGSFEAIRHKITPSVSWSYAPEVLPTDIQARVFGPTAARAQNTFTIGFNQTWEAKVQADEETGADVAVPGTPSLQPDSVPGDSIGAPSAAQALVPGGLTPAPGLGGDEELSRLPPSQNVVLLGLQTNAITYDLIEADSTGNFIDGFRTLSLTNRVVSDYLRGLNLSFTHELFDDSERFEGGTRTFSPHLSQLSLGFALDQNSGFLRTVGRLLGIEPDTARVPPPTEREPEVVDPALQTTPDSPLDQFTGFDSDRVIPGRDPFDARPTGEGWRADVNYSLNRPRGSQRGSSLRAQMLQGRLSFTPSESWTVDWSTSYDVEARRFNDHVVNLRRDLHEWEARFGFVQTATGNWSFQFEVALRANQDLRFDYRQRSLDRF